MASDPPAFEVGNSVGRDPRTRHPKPSRDGTVYLRVAQANGALANVMKESAITLAESQKLLAEVDALLRR